MANDIMYCKLIKSRQKVYVCLHFDVNVTQHLLYQTFPASLFDYLSSSVTFLKTAPSISVKFSTACALTRWQAEECRCQDAAIDPASLPPAALLHRLLHQLGQLHHQRLLLPLLATCSPVLPPPLSLHLLTVPSPLPQPPLRSGVLPPLLRYGLHVSCRAAAASEQSHRALCL